MPRKPQEINGKPDKKMGRQGRLKFPDPILGKWYNDKDIRHHLDDYEDDLDIDTIIEEQHIEPKYHRKLGKYITAFNKFMKNKKREAASRRISQAVIIPPTPNLSTQSSQHDIPPQTIATTQEIGSMIGIQSDQEISPMDVPSYSQSSNHNHNTIRTPLRDATNSSEISPSTAPLTEIVHHEWSLIAKQLAKDKGIAKLR